MTEPNDVARRQIAAIESEILAIQTQLQHLRHALTDVVGWPNTQTHARDIEAMQRRLMTIRGDAVLYVHALSAHLIARWSEGDWYGASFSDPVAAGQWGEMQARKGAQSWSLELGDGGPAHGTGATCFVRVHR